MLPTNPQLDLCHTQQPHSCTLFLRDCLVSRNQLGKPLLNSNRGPMYLFGGSQPKCVWLARRKRKPISSLPLLKNQRKTDGFTMRGAHIEN